MVWLPKKTILRGIVVSEVRFKLLDRIEDSLIGWASCVVNGSLHLNNIAIRYGRDGGIVLTFPAKRSKTNTKYYYFNPITREAADAFHRAIVGRLKMVGHEGAEDGTSNQGREK